MGTPGLVERVAVLDDYISVAAELVNWSDALPGTAVDFFHDVLRGDELIAALQPYDVVVAMRERTALPRPVLAALPKLRLLVTTGMRNAAIDMAAAGELGMMVCGTGVAPTQTAELTWALILATVRDVAGADRAMRSGGWQTRLDGDLAGRTLGVVGLGRLGARVARIGVAFGMDVIAWSPHLTAARAAEYGARAVSKAELFGSADYVTLHLVLSDATRGVVGAEDLARMRPNAWLVNTSRAGLVDEDALLRALAAGQFAGAALDVFEIEPLPADHPLRREPRALLSPHMGYVTADSFRLFYREVLEDIVAFASGTPVRQLV